MKFTALSDFQDLAARSRSVLPGSELTMDAPLPMARRAHRRTMQYIATLMHCATDAAGGLAADLLPGSLSAESGAILFATATQSPLYLQEAETVAVAMRCPVLILRRADVPTSPVLSVDVAVYGPDRLDRYADYRLFRGLCDVTELVPLGTGPSIRLMRHGLFVTENGPYADDWDRSAGIERACAHLVRAMIGSQSW